MRSLLLLLFRRIVAIYFRQVEVAGAVPTPATGGRLFAANHVNALVDPILVLTQAPCAISPIAKSTLWKIPGLKWLLEAVDAVPIVRRRDDPGKSVEENAAVFERVAAHLAKGGNILIFPEGTSHNEPHLLALRSGAGRMLERARVESHELTFQAVALEFDERDVFRSRSLILFGPVRRVGGLDANAITEQLRADLSELLVEGSTWEERVMVVRVAEMFANDQKARTLENINVLGRRIEEARRVLSQTAPETVSAIEAKLRDYLTKLDALEVTDEAVARISHGGGIEIASDRLARAVAMILTLPAAMIAFLVYFLPYQLPRLVTRKIGDDPDTSSTYKLGVGLVVYPVWALLLIVLAFVELRLSTASIATGLLLLSPFAALPWLDRWDRLKGRLSLLIPSSKRKVKLEALAMQRGTLMKTLEAANASVPATGT